MKKMSVFFQGKSVQAKEELPAHILRITAEIFSAAVKPRDSHPKMSGHEKYLCCCSVENETLCKAFAEAYRVEVSLSETPVSTEGYLALCFYRRNERREYYRLYGYITFGTGEWFICGHGCDSTFKDY